MSDQGKPYHEAYPAGTEIRIGDRDFLDCFKASWKYHHKLTSEQLNYAGYKATVKGIAFYHGGDPLYALGGIPGLWHEQCLRAAD